MATSTDVNRRQPTSTNVNQAMYTLPSVARLSTNAYATRSTENGWNRYEDDKVEVYAQQLLSSENPDATSVWNWLKEMMLHYNMVLAGGSALAVAREYFTHKDSDLKTQGVQTIAQYTALEQHDIDFYVSIDNFFDACSNMETLSTSETQYIVAPPYDESFLSRNHIVAIKTFITGSRYRLNIQLMCVDTTRTSIQHVWNNFDLNVCQVALRVHARTGAPSLVMEMSVETERSIRDANAVLNSEYHEAYLNGNRFLERRVEKYRRRGYAIVNVPSNSLSRLPPIATIESSKDDNTVLHFPRYEARTPLKWRQKTIHGVAVDHHRINIENKDQAQLVAFPWVRFKMIGAVLQLQQARAVRLAARTLAQSAFDEHREGVSSSRFLFGRLVKATAKDMHIEPMSSFTELLRYTVALPPTRTLYSTQDGQNVRYIREKIGQYIATCYQLPTSDDPNDTLTNSPSVINAYANIFRGFSSRHESWSRIEEEIFEIAPECLAYVSDIYMPYVATNNVLHKTTLRIEMDAAYRRAFAYVRFIETIDTMPNYVNSLIIGLDETLSKIQQPATFLNWTTVHTFVGRSVEVSLLLLRASYDYFDYVAERYKRINVFLQHVCELNGNDDTPSLHNLIGDYPLMLHVIGEDVLNAARRVETHLLYNMTATMITSADIKRYIVDAIGVVVEVSRRLTDAVIEESPNNVRASTAMQFMLDFIRKWVIPIDCFGINARRYSAPPLQGRAFCERELRLNM